MKKRIFQVINDKILETEHFTKEFHYPICYELFSSPKKYYVIYYDHIYIVCLLAPDDSDDSEAECQIYGLNENGETIWRVQNPSDIYHYKENKIEWAAIAGRFDGIYMKKPGTLTAFAYSFFYTIDYKTGKIIGREFTK